MILLHVMGILGGCNGFSDLVIHRTNSPSLLMDAIDSYSSVTVGTEDDVIS